MAVEVFMPKMSDHMEAGELVQWLVAEGEPVEAGQPIAEVMTDKAVAELQAPAAGVLKGFRPGARAGAIVPVGETIAFVAGPDEPVPALPPLVSRSQTSPQRSAGPASPPGSGPAQSDAARVRATPVARRLARDLGLDLTQVKGSGPGGSVREDDVRAHANALAAMTTPAPQDTEWEWLDLTPAQRLTGQRMLESAQTAPQFALSLSADMANVLRWRDAVMQQALATTGTRLSLTAILVRVVGAALRQHPRANAAFADGRVRVYRRVHVGVAMGMHEGLVVPVIRDADQKSLVEVNRELAALREKAERMRFAVDELAGGTFTLSNLGMYGIDRFTAILNPPQAAILAVGRIINTPVALADDIVGVRPLMSLTLTVDHRVMDGVQASQFLREVRQRLEQPDLVLDEEGDPR